MVWWDVAPPPAAVSYPWSRREFVALREAGVRLPEVDDLLSHRSREWLRPVLNATEMLVLVAHEDEGGTHPVLTQIESCVDGIEGVEVEPALLRGEPTLAPLAVRTRELPLRRLPRSVVQDPLVRVVAEPPPFSLGGPCHSKTDC